MTTIQTQQELANEVLKVTQQHVTDGAIIAGGAPRNWYAKKLARDIDIFCMTDSFDHKLLGDELEIEIKRLSKEDIKKSDLTMEYSGFGLYEATIEEEIIQWICIGHHFDSLQKYVMESFDYNICKCFYDDGEIILSKEAMKDFTNKTLTFTAESLGAKNLKCLPQRTKKLKAIFPDYEINIE